MDVNGIDHFTFPEGMCDGQKYKQFGNSVSIPVIKAMADYMMEKLDEFTANPISLIEKLVDREGRITRRDVMDLLNVDEARASYILRRAVAEKILEKSGNTRNAI